MDGGESSIEGISQRLAEKVAKWLAEKKDSWKKEDESTNAESLMGEAMLMIPVADHLLAEKWRGLIGEWSYFKGNDKDAPGNLSNGQVNFDLYAEKGAEKVVIEWKYLKKSKANNQRIIIDFVKLALPGRGYNARLLVVVHKDESSLLRGIAQKGRTIFSVFSSPELQIESDLCGSVHSITGDEKKRIGKILQLDPPLRSFSVEKIGEENNVSIFSVSRSFENGERSISTTEAVA